MNTNEQLRIAKEKREEEIYKIKQVYLNGNNGIYLPYILEKPRIISIGSDETIREDLDLIWQQNPSSKRNSYRIFIRKYAQKFAKRIYFCI